MLFLVSKRSNISPLHHQAIKGRKIVITERPDLHLVWYYERILIKPVPSCLLNFSFFDIFLGPGCHRRSAASGFLRTYASLVLFLRGWDYLETNHQYLDYFSQFLAPYLFVFCAVTVLLAAMQTTLTADPDSLSRSTMSSFCTFSIVLVSCGLLFFPVLYFAFQVRELVLFLVYKQKAKD
ncbi:hypothetical protein LZ31DRAFT_612891 [Colletotrichum somersetense]|nr:hypothetical protein LZ31DRAFT_612891 [Colletotrichum somersetense]